MTLILAARCWNGCVVVADIRTHIKSGTEFSYQDNFIKVVKVSPYLIYNHGYNRINDEDWKNQASNLTPDTQNPIYQQIQKEMQTKSDKVAHYVFINKSVWHELKIDSNEEIKITTQHKNDRFVSGSGGKYADISSLQDLKSKNVQFVQRKLEKVFDLANKMLLQKGGNEFSSMRQTYLLHD